MDANTYAGRIWGLIVCGLAKLHRAQSGAAGITVVLATLAGSSIFATASMANGTEIFEGFADLYQASVSRTSGSLEVRGSIIATASGAPMKTDTIQLTLGSFGNGFPVALNQDAPANQRLIISYTDGAIFNPSVRYSAREVTGDGDDILEPGEVVLVTIRAEDLPSGELAAALGANQRWSLELISPLGGSVEVSRTMPFAIQPVMRLP